MKSSNNFFSFCLLLNEANSGQKQTKIKDVKWPQNDSRERIRTKVVRSLQISMRVKILGDIIKVIR